MYAGKATVVGILWLDSGTLCLNMKDFLKPVEADLWPLVLKSQMNGVIPRILKVQPDKFMTY